MLYITFLYSNWLVQFICFEAVCPDFSWRRFRDDCYRVVCDSSHPVAEVAHTQCQTMGGPAAGLATIVDTEEENFIENMMLDEDVTKAFCGAYGAWIGLISDDGTSGYNFTILTGGDWCITCWGH